MLTFEKIFNWKSDLLVHGCRITPGISFPTSIATKKIHLYAHSTDKLNQPIPDDLLLPHNIIVRIRYQINSPYVLENDESGYHIRNEVTEEELPVSFIPGLKGADVQVSGTPISSICSYLGTDLLGITPSNYCFYFQNNKQCRFCEILPTYKNEVEFPKTFKKLDIIEKSVLTALEHDSRLKFLAITTGNIHSYDETVDYFAQIGDRLQKHPLFKNAEQVLATLMPPEDLSKIALLREKGFTKIYFPIEVYEPNHFANVCPGKADYGYDRILKALETAVESFGKGNVYTNLVYGIQSLNKALTADSYDPERENALSSIAVKELLARNVIPAFTLYHFGGYNAIGNLKLSKEHVRSFFKSWGQWVHHSGLVTETQQTVLFGPISLSNTLFNDGFRLAKQKV